MTVIFFTDHIVATVNSSAYKKSNEMMQQLKSIGCAGGSTSIVAAMKTSTQVTGPNCFASMLAHFLLLVPVHVMQPIGSNKSILTTLSTQSHTKY